MERRAAGLEVERRPSMSCIAAGSCVGGHRGLRCGKTRLSIQWKIAGPASRESAPIAFPKGISVTYGGQLPMHFPNRVF